MKKANIGTVISGTMRHEDLIPAFCEELRRLGTRDKRLTDIERRSARRGYYDEVESVWHDLYILEGLLSDHAPYFCYFGAHQGDGSDFGFWPSWDGIQDDDDILKISDLSEIPTGYTGAALLVNDHGNSTMYKVTRGRCRELWGVV